MFKRNSSPIPSSQEKFDLVFNESNATVIQSGTLCEGKIIGNDDVIIAGKFYGEIIIKGTLLIRESGEIFCQKIIAKKVIVNGKTHGNISAKVLHISATGKIFGDVVVTSFITEEGSSLKGSIRMEEELDLDFNAEIDSAVIDKLAGDSTTDAPDPVVEKKRSKGK